MVTELVVSGHPVNSSSSTIDLQTESNSLADLATSSYTSAPQSTSSSVGVVPVPTQQSVSQHASRVATVLPLNTLPGTISVQLNPQCSPIHVQQSVSQHAAFGSPVSTSDLGLNSNAIPFTPHSNPENSSCVADILKDHSEVEQVLNGGVGTAPVDCPAWQIGSVLSLSEAPASNGLLPFESCEFPSPAGAAAQPVIKTKHLKEFKVYFNNKVFIDRLLPPPAKPMVQHPRFTPAYYLSLHNLTSRAGRDGNGFWYPANTPNYKGARIPLAHTGLKIGNWRRLLIGYGEGNELLQFMEFGFPLGLVDSPDLVPCERNHGSAYQYFPHIDKFITSEILRGGLTGPFTESPWPNTMVSPLMTAPKKPSDRRPVFDATFGDKSVNNATPCNLYLGAPTVYTYPKVDDLRKIILTCGQGCYLWKRDLHRFYLQIPMDPVEYRHVACIWRGLLFFFVALMFGLRHSGLQGQRITDALAWIHRQLGLELPGEKPYNCVNYCDDLGGAESTKSRANQSFTGLGTLLGELGLAESKDKARAPSTTMVYLGVEFNTIAMTMAIPPDKLAELKDEIERWLQKTTATKKSLQSLLGKLFWVSRVVYHSRTFMCRLLTQLRDMSSLTDNVKVKLTEDCRKDILWWRTFIKEFNGVTMIENDEAIRLSLPQLMDTPAAICVGDATLTGGGAWHGTYYWSRRLPFLLRDHTIPVHVKEFLVVIVSTKLWGSSWSGKVIQIFCDNDAVCDVVDGERPTDPKMLSLLREFKFLVCTFRFYPTMRKISSSDNAIADHISRRHDDESAQELFASNGLGQMSLTEAPDKFFDLTATW